MLVCLFILCGCYNEDMNTAYDKTDAESIEKYARLLVGKTFRDVIEADSDGFSNIDDGGFSKKGGLGNLLEERYFHYGSNSDARPDFPEAGVELKTTPYKVNSRGEKVAKERLVITMIDYMNVINEAFDESHLWLKARLMLLIYYLYQKEISDRLDYRIDYVSLFTPPEEDLEIIKEDYDKIVDKIRRGLAHELSEADTMYLAACTKSSDSSVRRPQPNSDIPAKPRAFSLKSSYMTYVLNNYIIPNTASAAKVDAIVTEGQIVSFDKYVYDKIAEYRGRSIEELCNEFNIPSDTPAKNLGALIAYRILGVKSNSAEEFVKAGIKVKTIRVNANNTITESMSFPAMSFAKISEEEWEDSDFYQLLTETKFFFVVFKYDEAGTLRLLGCKFWNIPSSDLSEVENVWKRTKQLVIGDLVIERVNGKYTSNFPKASENPVSHVRPHARNAEDVDVLPDGRVFPKQCFWLNNSYILSQIQDLL